MKKTLVLFGLLMSAGIGLSSRADAGVGISFGIFYSSLSPHGEWIAVDHDVYAWRPMRVAAGWRPYYYGGWAWTDYGWYWLSDEPWGWATYHYGRWYYDEYYGWIWIPGYDWAPAWVEWRYGGGNVGWAPLGPYAVFSIGFGIYYTHHWATPMSWWTFAPCGALYHRDIHRYAYRSNESSRLIGRTRGAGSVRHDGERIVSRGPERSYVERRGGGERLERLRVVDSERPGRQEVVRSEGTSRVEAYRPRVDATRQATGVDRPERLRSAERTVPLDTRNIDVRSGDRQREEGRDLQRAQERERELTRPSMPRGAMERDRLERPGSGARTPSGSSGEVGPGAERPSRESQPRIERAPWPRERIERQAPAPRQTPRVDRPERQAPAPRQTPRVDRPERQAPPRYEQPERKSNPPRYERPERSSPPRSGGVRQSPAPRETPRSGGGTRGSDGGRKSRER